MTEAELKEEYEAWIGMLFKYQSRQEFFFFLSFFQQCSDNISYLVRHPSKTLEKHDLHITLRKVLPKYSKEDIK